MECYAVVHPNGDICAESDEEPGDFDQELRDMIEADFAFIAAAREAVPKLVAEVRRLRQREDQKSAGPWFAGRRRTNLGGGRPSAT